MTHLTPQNRDELLIENNQLLDSVDELYEEAVQRVKHAQRWLSHNAAYGESCIHAEEARNILLEAKQLDRQLNGSHPADEMTQVKMRTALTNSLDEAQSRLDECGDIPEIATNLEW